MRFKHLFLGVAFGAAAIVGASQSFAQSTLQATYYTIPESGDADFGNVPCCSFVFTDNANGEVLGGALGPNGLPLYNTAFGGPALSDVDSHGQLTWWSGTSTGGGPVSVPIGQNLFPPNGSNSGGDGNGFQTATFAGTLNAAGTEKVTFNLSADDDAFLAVDGNIVLQDGGVHPLDPTGVSVTELLSGGSHSVEIFYADRHTVAAALDFSESITAVPEPASWAMMLVGFGGLGATMRMRRKQTAVTA
jgi:fibro-slime domain-containing protein